MLGTEYMVTRWYVTYIRELLVYFTHSPVAGDPFASLTSYYLIQIVEVSLSSSPSARTFGHG